MKQVAIRRCQVRIDGIIRTVDEGMVVDYAEEHAHLRPVEGETPEAEEVNFLTASGPELLAAKWKFSDAAAIVKETYNVELNKTEKTDIVAQILDARYRHVNDADVDHTR